MTEPLVTVTFCGTPPLYLNSTYLDAGHFAVRWLDPSLSEGRNLQGSFDYEIAGKASQQNERQVFSKPSRLWPKTRIPQGWIYNLL
jgi:hypothetical protein